MESRISALDELALADPRHTVERALDAARELLGMDIAYFSEFTDSQQIIRSVSGDSSSFGFEEGTAAELEETYCMRMVSGVIPSLIPDAPNDVRVNDLPGTDGAGIGSYVGVPLRLPDGRVYGTMCCLSHEAKKQLDARDVQFMRVLARVLGDYLGTLTTSAARIPVGRGHGDAVARLSLWFAGAANAAGAARTALAAIDEHLDARAQHDLRLVVTELMANSVKHAGIGPGSSVGLDAEVRPRTVRVEITDPGPGFEPVVKPATPEDPDRMGGWGLLLVDQLTERWGVERGELTRVWFELALERDDQSAATAA